MPLLHGSGALDAPRVAIRMAADDTGLIDLRPESPGAADPEVLRLASGRLQRLERVGLAAAAGRAGGSSPRCQARLARPRHAWLESTCMEPERLMVVSRVERSETSGVDRKPLPNRQGTFITLVRS